MEVSYRQITVGIILIVFCSFLLPLACAKHDGHHLHVGFYRWTCPQAEQIVADVVLKAFIVNPGIAAGLLRLHFHDCFVNGCDASILLDSTPSGEPTEKESPANGDSLRGLEAIDKAKARLEHECPGIVSCADTLAFAAREAVVLSGLTPYRVPAGRRDSRVSRATDISGNLPSASDPVKKTTKLFARKGLTQEEMVILSGAHSIGVAHCLTFDYRLYNFNSTHTQDPSLNPFYAPFLKMACPRGAILFSEGSSKGSVAFDDMSPNELDNEYYIKLLQGRGLLQSDQALADDPRTSDLVNRLAFDQHEWSKRFGKAMIKLGRVDVITGTKGEIRKHCRSIN